MAQDLPRARASDLIPEHVLAHIPGLAAAGGSARAARLVGGTVNASFRVDTGAGQFVVRLHAPAIGVLGVNHAREARLHAAAAAAGLAPALVHVDPEHRFMIMEYVQGTPWQPADFSRVDRLRQLGVALRSLHAINPPVVAPFNLPALLHHHYRRLEQAEPADQRWLAQLMERAATAFRACRSGDRGSTMMHGDLHHSNLIGAERLYLLDWEYAAVADPLFDVACVLAYYPGAVAHADTLLDAARLTSEVDRQMLDQATWLYVLVSYLWYRSRRLATTVKSEDLAVEQELLKRLG